MGSTLKVDNLQNSDGTRTLASDSGTVWSWGAGVPQGTILQVQSFAYTDDNKSGTGTTFADTGLTVSITPTATSSKIMVMAQVSMGASTNYRFAIRLVRDSTAIFVGDSSGSRTLATAAHQGSGGNMIDVTFPVMFLDSPSTTSATTYKIQAAAEQSAGSWYLNRGGASSFADNSTVYVAASSITVMEVAG